MQNSTVVTLIKKLGVTSTEDPMVLVGDKMLKITGVKRAGNKTVIVADGKACNCSEKKKEDAKAETKNTKTKTVKTKETGKK